LFFADLSLVYSVRTYHTLAFKKEDYHLENRGQGKSHRSQGRENKKDKCPTSIIIPSLGSLSNDRLA